MPKDEHPRDRYITVFGRKPVLEALRHPDLQFGRCLVAHNASGTEIKAILSLARNRQVKLERCNPKFVNRISRNARQDQGVALDVDTGLMSSLETWIAQEHSGQSVLLDGIDTPGNVGMIIRSAVAASVSGIIMPRRGCPDLTPLVLKASAGTAFHAPLVRTETAALAAEQLCLKGYVLAGLRADAEHSLFSAALPDKLVWVLGNETHGISESVTPFIRQWVNIPMPGSTESLNVAMASTIAVFEGVRRQMENKAPTGA